MEENKKEERKITQSEYIILELSKDISNLNIEIKRLSFENKILIEKLNAKECEGKED